VKSVLTNASASTAQKIIILQQELLQYEIIPKVDYADKKSSFIATLQAWIDFFQESSEGMHFKNERLA